MKSQMLIIAGVMCTTLSAPAFGVVQCVALNENTTCTGYHEHGMTWYTTCGSIQVEGVAMCGNEDGGFMGAASENPVVSTNDQFDNQNIHCWCKMTSPATSMWIYIPPMIYTDSGCLSSCARLCAVELTRTQEFKEQMFSYMY